MKIDSELLNATLDFLIARVGDPDSSDSLSELCQRAGFKQVELGDPNTKQIPTYLMRQFDRDDPEVHYSRLLVSIFAVYCRAIPGDPFFLGQIARYALGLAQRREPQAKDVWGARYLYGEAGEKLRTALDDHLTAYVASQLKGGAFDDARTLLEELRKAGAPLPSIVPLLDDHPALRYEQAVAYRRQGRWDDALKLLAALLEHHPVYTPARYFLAEIEQERNENEDYQRQADAAWAARDWDTAKERLGYLASQSWEHAHERLEKLRACQSLVAEGDEHVRIGLWAAAEAVYSRALELVDTYAEAQRGQLRARAHYAVERKDWPQAEVALGQLLADWPDTPGEAELLTTVRRLRQGLARLRWHSIIDPRLRWNGPFPYQALFNAGLIQITPNTSMEMIAALQLQLEFAASDAVLAAALEVVQTVEHRLFVDAFLYPKAPLQQIVVFLEHELLTTGRLPIGVRVVQRFSWQASLVFVALDDRAAAAETLREHQHATPKESVLAHALGLMYLADAEELAVRGLPDEALDLWRAAIGQWGTALADHEYWSRWVAERVTHYQVPAEPMDDAQVDRLLRRLEDELRRRLDDCRSQFQDDAAHAHPFDLLRLELSAELEAAHLVRRDLPDLIAEDPALPYGGPLLMRSLAVEPLLAVRLGQISQGAPPQGRSRNYAREEALQLFRWLYSWLRLGAAAFRQAQPTLALTLLGDTDPVASDAIYETLAQREQVATRDWLRLRVEAHLLRAFERLRGGEPWDEGAQAVDWKEALGLADRMGLREQVASQIGSGLLRVAQKLRKEWDDSSDIGPLDRSISALHVAAQIIDRSNDLRAELIEQLHSRSGHLLGKRRFSQAAQDTSWALTLDPDNPYTLALHFAVIIQIAKADEDEARALATLAQVEQQIQEQLRQHPDYTQRLIGLVAQARDTIGERQDPDRALERLLGNGAHSGLFRLLQRVDQLRTERPIEALDLLEQCWQLDAANPQLHARLLGIMANLSLRFNRVGKKELFQPLLDRWLPQARDAGLSSEQLGFLAHGGQVLMMLTTLRLAHEVAGSHIWIKMESDYVGTQKMRLSFGDDDLLIWAELPPIEGDELVALGALLMCTANTVFCRLSDIEGLGYGLVCHMSLRHLENNAEWLEFLMQVVRGYVTFAPERFADQGALDEHINARRIWIHRNNPRSALLPKALQLIKPMCQKLGYRYDEDNRCILGEGFERAYVLYHRDGLQLITPYQPLPIDFTRNRWLRTLIGLNASAGPSKLALWKSNELVVCCYEAPYLDYQSLRLGVDSLAATRTLLQRELS